MEVILLVAGAAVAHATWNVTMKRVGASGVHFLWLSFAVGAVVYAPFGAWSLATDGTDLLRWMPLAAVSGLFQIGYFLLLQRGYRLGDVSVVYPLARGTGPLLSVIFAIILFGERPGLIALAGALVVVGGVVVIGLAGDRAGAHKTATGIRYGLLIGVLIAGYTLWDSASVTTWGMPVVGLYWGSVLVQCLVLAPAALRHRRVLSVTAKKHGAPAIVVGVLAPLAYILILLAIQQAPISIIAPAREVSVVLVGLAGWLLFKEPHPLQRLLGAGIVLIGVGLLAAG
ncbi:MAG: EamA family transporter [Microbacteriaceae bacterium]